MENKVVIHMKDEKIRKGVIQNFDPSADSFYLLPAEGGGVPLHVRLEDMKAVFYVRDYLGNSDFVARKDFEEAQRSGHRVILRFKDGEEMWGTVPELSEGGSGFFFYPTDRSDNNIRVFVIRSSLDDLEVVP